MQVGALGGKGFIEWQKGVGTCVTSVVGTPSTSTYSFLMPQNTFEIRTRMLGQFLKYKII